MAAHWVDDATSRSNQTNSTGSIAAHPCKKNARMGHPLWEWCTQKSLKVGHPALRPRKILVREVKGYLPTNVPRHPLHSRACLGESFCRITPSSQSHHINKRAITTRPFHLPVSGAGTSSQLRVRWLCSCAFRIISWRNPSTNCGYSGAAAGVPIEA